MCRIGSDDEWPDGTMAFEGLHVRRHELEAHCRLLRDACDPIDLHAWRGAVEGSVRLPPRPVLVTFDDGYRSVFSRARPILERYEIPAVVFACTDPMARRRTFWYDALALARGERAVEDAKTAPYEEWCALHATWSLPVDDDAPHAPLTSAEVRALGQHPLFEVGGHSATHPILSRAPREVQRAEIANNAADLEAWAGYRPRVFAYPNGRPGVDYAGDTIELLMSCGFECAFTTGSGFATSGQPMFERTRFLMLADVSAPELAHRLCYSWRR